MKKLKFFLLLVMCLTCTGCFQAESDIKIADTGEVVMRNKFLGVPYLAEIIENAKKSLLESNPDAKVKSVNEGNYYGYEVEIFFPDMEKFAANKIEMYQARPGKCTGIQISKGWFYDSCTFDLLFEGREVESSDLAESMAQALFAQIKFDFVVGIPYAADSSNADFMSNDGKILTWNIAPALINGQDKSIKLSFKIYNRVRIAATFFLALLIIAGVIYNLSQAKNKELEKKGLGEQDKNPNP